MKSERSSMRETEALHRALDTGNFTFPRSSNLPHGYFRERNWWPLIGMSVLCFLAFGAVVAMIWAGVQG